MSKPPARRGDLTADLLADLESDAARDTAVAAGSDAVVTPMRGGAAKVVDLAAVAQPSLQTTLRITPMSWRLPGLRFRSGGFSGAIGPVEIDLSFGPLI